MLTCRQFRESKGSYEKSQYKHTKYSQIQSKGTRRNERNDETRCCERQGRERERENDWEMNMMKNNKKDILYIAIKGKSESWKGRFKAPTQWFKNTPKIESA